MTTEAGAPPSNAAAGRPVVKRQVGKFRWWENGVKIWLCQTFFSTVRHSLMDIVFCL